MWAFRGFPRTRWCAERDAQWQREADDRVDDVAAKLTAATERLVAREVERRLLPLAKATSRAVEARDSRGREVDGLVQLPPEPAPVHMRIVRGPFAGLVGLYAGQSSHERVAILLALLGGERQVTLPAADVVAVR